jgi:hypothetical protein
MDHPTTSRGSTDMASPAKVTANRRNAQRSTGPRSPAGKARTRYNALQHGLTIPIAHDAGTTDEIMRLANVFCGTSANRVAQELAMRAAEAEFEMLRVRRCRVDLINKTAKQEHRRHWDLPEGERATLAFAKKSNILVAFDRYEHRAFARRNLALRRLRALRKAAQREKNVEVVGPRLQPREPDGENRFEQLVGQLDITSWLRRAIRTAPGSRYYFNASYPTFIRGRSTTNVLGCIELQVDHGTLELSFDVVGEKVRQRFRLERVAQHVGGYKWFVQCPETQRRVQALYLGLWERSFGSRHALGMSYKSKRLSAAEAHGERSVRLLERIGGPDESRPPPSLPPRPKHMRHTTYDNICDEIRRQRQLDMCAHLGWTLPWDDDDWPNLKRLAKKSRDKWTAKDKMADAQISHLRQMSKDAFAELASEYAARMD